MLSKTTAEDPVASKIRSNGPLSAAGARLPSPAHVLQAAHRERGPPGLVARPHAPSVVAIEVLVEQHQLLPVRVRRVPRLVTVTGPSSCGVGEEQAGKPGLQLQRDFLQRQPGSRPYGAFDRELRAVEVVVPLQRLQHQEIDREPDRPPPIRVASEESGVPLGRHVVHPIRDAHHVELVGMLAVHAAHGAKAERREELTLVQDVAQHPLQALAGWDRQETS
jgi:hypothetical protein